MRQLSIVYALFLAGLVLARAGTALALDLTQRISQYQHTAWRVQEGFFAGAPHVVAQTSDGYLWIGTTNGLLRFDGVQFEPFTGSGVESLRSPIVSSLLADRDGSLWIGTSTGLEHWKNGQLLHFPQTLVHFGRVQTVIRAQDGSIWVAKDRDQTKGPICQLQRNDFRCFGSNEGVTAPVAESLLEDADGTFWYTDDRSLFHWDPKGHRALSGGIANVGKVENFTSISLGSDRAVWMGLQNNKIGLATARGGEMQVFEANGIDGRHLSVTAVFFDSKQALWLGTSNDGLYRIIGTKVDHFNAGDGLSSDNVDNISQDREGNLWVTTAKGLDRFRDVAVTSYTSREGLTGDLVNGAMAASDGSIWIDNWASLDVLRPDGSMISFRGGKELPGQAAVSLMEDEKKRIWVGIDDGLQIFDGRAFRKVSMPGSASTGIIFAMTKDKRGDVWAIAGDGRLGGGRLLHFADDGLKELVPNELLPVGYTHAIGVDSQNAIWVPLNEDRVARWNSGRAETFALHQPPKPNGGISGIVVLPQDIVIVSTFFNGLSLVFNGEVRQFSVEQGLPCARIWAMTVGKSLWLYGECGVIELQPSELELWWKTPTMRPKAKVLDTLDGAHPSQHAAFPGASVSPSGHVWFANGAFLQELNPEAAKSEIPLLPVLVQQLRADGKLFSLAPDVILPALTHDIQIDYSSPSFAIPQRVHFRYRLDGIREEWIDSGNRRQALFSDLHPGIFTFRVSAAMGQSAWTPESTIRFRVLPTLYQTTWFAWACAALAVMTLCLGYYIRVGAIKRSVQARMKVRMDERERIARDLHDTLFQDMNGVLLAIDNSTNTLPEEHPTRIALKKVLLRSDQVMAKSRERVLELRAEDMRGMSIGEALAEIGMALAAERDMTFRLIEEGAPQTLHPVVFQEVLRIGREALLNAFQHSRGKLAEVGIIFSHDRFSLVVRDDGVGIDASVLSDGGKFGHFGLKGMAERANKLGAKFTLRSSPMAGTEIELSISKKLAWAPLDALKRRPRAASLF